jgi:hypothetical protein
MKSGLRLAAHIVGIGKTERHTGVWWRKRLVGKTKHRWDDNIKLYLKEI